MIKIEKTKNGFNFRIDNENFDITFFPTINYPHSISSDIGQIKNREFFLRKVYYNSLNEKSKILYREYKKIFTEISHVYDFTIKQEEEIKRKIFLLVELLWKKNLLFTEVSLYERLPFLQGWLDNITYKDISNIVAESNSISQIFFDIKKQGCKKLIDNKDFQFLCKTYLDIDFSQTIGLQILFGNLTKNNTETLIKVMKNISILKRMKRDIRDWDKQKQTLEKIKKEIEDKYGYIQGISVVITDKNYVQDIGICFFNILSNYCELDELEKKLNLIPTRVNPLAIPEHIKKIKNDNSLKLFSTNQSSLIREENWEDEKLSLFIPYSYNDVQKIANDFHNCFARHEWETFLSTGERLGLALYIKNKPYACVDIDIRCKNVVNCLRPCNNSFNRDEKDYLIEKIKKLI